MRKLHIIGAGRVWLFDAVCFDEQVWKQDRAIINVVQNADRVDDLGEFDGILNLTFGDYTAKFAMSNESGLWSVDIDVTDFVRAQNSGTIELTLTEGGSERYLAINYEVIGLVKPEFVPPYPKVIGGNIKPIDGVNNIILPPQKQIETL